MFNLLKNNIWLWKVHIYLRRISSIILNNHLKDRTWNVFRPAKETFGVITVVLLLLLLLPLTAGSSLQWSFSLGKSPRGFSVEPLLISTRVQLPYKSWTCGVQALPVFSHWSHPGHWPQKALWLLSRVQCKGNHFDLWHKESPSHQSSRQWEL